MEKPISIVGSRCAPNKTSKSYFHYPKLIMEHDNKKFTGWDTVKVILLLLSILWLGSILKEDAPACFQPSGFDRTLMEQGYSPCAQFIGGLLLPFAAVVLFLASLRRHLRRFLKR